MAKKRYDPNDLTGPAPTPSLSQRLGAGAISGISAVANTLDLPGSMVRDTANAFATGNFKDNNPFDQLLTPFSANNRTTGRDLNRTLGLASQSDTTPNWWGGLATDVLTDPLTYFTFGGSALSKFGKVAKAAGIHGDEAARLLAKGLGKAPGSFGKRSARLGLTGDLIQKADPAAFQRLSETAGRMKYDLLNNMNEPMGGMAKFWPTGTVLGQGKASQYLAGKADELFDAVRYAKIPGTTVRPVADIENLFAKSHGKAIDRGTRQLNVANSWDKERVRAAQKLEHLRFSRAFRDLGFGDKESDIIGTHIQYPQNAPAHLQPLLHELRNLQIDQWPDKAKEIGMKLGDNQAIMEAMGSDALYKPRALTEGFGRSSVAGNIQPMSSFTPNSYTRWAWTNGIRNGGDAKLKEIGKRVLELKKAGVLDKDTMATLLEARFGADLDPHYLDNDVFQALAGSKKYKNSPTVATAQALMGAGKKSFRGKRLAIGDTWKQAADDLMRMSDEVLESGVWGNYPLADIGHASTRTAEGLTSAHNLMDYIVEQGKHNPGFFTPGEGSIPLGTLLAGNPKAGIKGLSMTAGDRTGGAAKWYWQHVHNLDISTLTRKQAKAKIREFRQLHVPAEHAQNLLHAFGEWSAPTQINAMLSLYDKFSTLTKGLFTSAKPSFHGRNFPSGQGANVMGEQFSANSLKDAFTSAFGGTLHGAAEVPLVQQEAARRGIQNLDDAMATKIAHELAAAHGATGTAGAVMPTHQTHIGGSVNDILSELPDERPFSIAGTFGKLFGMGGTTWNPRKATIRGVNSQDASTFAPIAAGEAVGAFTEHLNRFAPWWNMVKQGIDPAEAARRVGEAQVSYQNRFYTDFEQKVLNRLFLFYKYTKGQVPFTMRLLTEQPGGRLAQTLRAINRSRDDEENIPDWIKETTSIPLGTKEDGTKSYFTGLGLNFEDPLQFAQPNSQNLLMEGASRLNPAIKGPLEWMTGQSFFQKGGPHGGRPLEDLDPVLGRTLANIGNITGLRDSKKPVTYPGSAGVEHLLSNSPLSTMMTMARTATDPRKGLGAKSANLLTGLRITDVSPPAQDRELRQKVSAIEKELGAKVYSDVYMPAEVRAELNPNELAEYERLRALRQLLEARAKARKAR